MARTRLNPKLAKLRHPYTVDEVARLYGVHRNTVRNWIHKDGLPVLSDGRPFVIMGADLRAFLEARRSNAKRPCPPGHIYCFACRVPRRPAESMADFVPMSKGAGDLVALCETCGTTLHRRAKLEALPTILPGIPVRIVQAELHIAGPTPPFSICDLEVT